VILQAICYAFVLLGAAIVVFTREPRAQVFAFSTYGLALGMLFLVQQAPDVALSEIVGGSVAVPLVLLVTLARIRDRL